MAKGITVKTVVLYETMFGSTRQIAEAIAAGAEAYADVTLVSLADGNAPDISDTDLVIAGAPTHALTMPTAASRKQAQQWADDSTKPFTLDGDAATTGVREWLDVVAPQECSFATFDTRTGLMSHLPGSAAAQIDKLLRKRRMTRVARAESFIVENGGGLRDGELERATRWGAEVARSFIRGAESPTHTPPARG